MEKINETWKRHEFELERLLQLFDKELDVSAKHQFKLLQIRHQRETIQAFYEELK